MRLLASRIRSTTSESWTPAMRDDWAAQVDALRVAFEKPLDAFEAAETAGRVADAGHDGCVLSFGLREEASMNPTSPSFKTGREKANDLWKVAKIAGLIILVAAIIFRVYSAWSEKRMRERDRLLLEATRSATAELFDEACRDAASASCRDLLIHDAVNGAPCPAVKHALDEARAAMTKTPRAAKETAA